MDGECGEGSSDGYSFLHAWSCSDTSIVVGCRDLHAEKARGGSSIQRVGHSGSTQRISYVHPAVVFDALKDELMRDTQAVIQEQCRTTTWRAYSISR